MSLLILVTGEDVISVVKPLTNFGSIVRSAPKRRVVPRNPQCPAVMMCLRITLCNENALGCLQIEMAASKTLDHRRGETHISKGKSEIEGKQKD